MKRMNMVKGIIAFAAIAILSMGTANAQKYAYVNSEYILENIPEYKTAQQTLDNLSLTWQKRSKINTLSSTNYTKLIRRNKFF